MFVPYYMIMSCGSSFRNEKQ